MSRFAFAALLAALAAVLAAHADVPFAAAQDKKKNKKAKAAEVEVPKEGDGELGRVVLAFDPGAHTRPISALGFNKDQSKLVTVGWDYSIQVWNTATGERLDILRLPPFGRDNGFDQYRWTHAAVSADGAVVAVGGSSKVFGADKDGTRTRLVVVDVANRKIRRVVVDIGLTSRVSCLSLSADGDRLAIGTAGTAKAVYLLDGVKSVLTLPAGDTAAPAPQLVSGDLKQDADHVAVSRSGDRVVVAQLRGIVAAWDVRGKAAAGWKKTGEFDDPGHTHAVEWSPDGSHFARCWAQGTGGENRGIDLRGTDGARIKGWTFKELTPGFGSQAIGVTLRFVAADRLFVSAHGALGKGDGFGPLGVVLDPTTGKTVRRFSDGAYRMMYTPFGAASEGGDLAATTTDRGMEATIYRLSDGIIVSRCGSRTPTPTLVGWAADAKAPAVAWADAPQATPFNTTSADLKSAFDLSKVEPMATVAPAAFDLRRLRVGEWSVEYKQGPGGFSEANLKQDGVDGVKALRRSRSLTLVPNGNAQPLFAYARQDGSHLMGAEAFLDGADGKPLAAWYPVATDCRDMVSSPDGRYVLTTTGTHRLSIYRTDGSSFPLLNLVRANGEWVCWTPEGYYAASPGGEKLIGWAIHDGPNSFATFYPAERYAKHFHRPDVIKLAIEKGSVKEALAELDARPLDLNQLQPPAAKLELLEQRGAVVTVKATVQAKDKPVLAMRVMLNGRPLPGGQGTWEAASGKPPAGEFRFEIPAGQNEVKLLVRTDDGATAPDALVVRGPKSPGKQPTIYRVCVGIDNYDDAGLKLAAAARDASDVFVALGRDCVGPNNRFGAAAGELVTDKHATRRKVLDVLEDARLAAKAGDLVVVFFAGHGVKQGKAFYLLTREADVTKDLADKALSGADLADVLKKIECPVLLVLDACHSAGAVRSFRPATDDLTRELTSDAVGVTVLSAAMQNEVAGATSENGHFTAGLLKALKAGEGVPFDPYERQVYVHHLYSVAFSEVRRATNGKQNPFLNMPWTSPPLAVREVPGK